MSTAFRIGRLRSAFTLIELLVVIAIIAMLAGLIFLLAPQMLKKGNQVKSLSNMRQIASAFTMYAGDNDGRLPGRALDGSSMARWPTLLFDYIRDEKVYAAPDDPSNFIKRGTDPFSNAANNTSYIMNGGLDPGITQDQANERPIVLGSVDQPSKTILVGLIFNDANFYLDVANGDQNLINPKQFGSSNNYVFMDGSAKTMDAKEYKEANSRNGSDAWLWLVHKDTQ